MRGSIRYTLPIHDCRTQLHSNVHPDHLGSPFGPGGKYPEVLDMDAITLAEPLLSHSTPFRTVQTNVQVRTPDCDFSGMACPPHSNRTTLTGDAANPRSPKSLAPSRSMDVTKIVYGPFSSQPAHSTCHSHCATRNCTIRL
jgi:hypothetical protein